MHYIHTINTTVFLKIRKIIADISSTIFELTQYKITRKIRKIFPFNWQKHHRPT